MTAVALQIGWFEPCLPAMFAVAVFDGEMSPPDGTLNATRGKTQHFCGITL
jgi:hypothetical protein